MPEKAFHYTTYTLFDYISLYGPSINAKCILGFRDGNRFAS
jgi:hypothetical protein